MGTEAYPMEAGALNYVVRRPVGVVGLINPWNLPLLLLCAKLAPALAMGNAVVLKPAEWTPMTATVLAEICAQAGVPDGVVNVVHGFGKDSAGEAIARHPGIGAIAFTGETTTGTAIMQAAVATLKKVSFELGGKNPNIVFADANLDEVVDASARAAFLNQGEICLCGSRTYVQRQVYDSFMEKFVAKSREHVVGDPLQPSTKVGALISREHYDRVWDTSTWHGRRAGRSSPAAAGRRGWRRGSSSNRRSSRVSAATAGSCRRRSSARWSPSSPSIPRRRS